jgi:hypothetical protein
MGVAHQILPVQMVVRVAALLILIRLVLEIHHRYLHLKEAMAAQEAIAHPITVLGVVVAHLP